MSATVGLSILSTTIDCNGTPVVVETNQHQGESDADFEDRHWAAVDAKIAACGQGSSADPSTYRTPVTCGSTTDHVTTTQGTSQSRDDFEADHHQAVQRTADECTS
jgi:hypothetical protein